MDSVEHLCEQTPAESPAYRQRSAGLNLELQANQSVLERLLHCYSVFAFTGGTIPSGQCDLAATDSYLESPFATNRISTEEVKRYRYLIESIRRPTPGVSERPRTLRGRKRIADALGRAVSEIRSLGSRFESALMNDAGPLSFLICQRLIHGSTLGHARQKSQTGVGQ